MAVTEPSTFGDLLRSYRRAAGLTQLELAERAGLSVRAITMMEGNAQHRPRKDTVQQLEEALELSPDDRTTFEAAAQRMRRTVQREEPSHHETTDVVGLRHLQATLPRPVTRIRRIVSVTLTVTVMALALIVTTHGLQFPGRVRSAPPPLEHVIVGWGGQAPVFSPLEYPVGVAVDREGNILVVDQLADRIRTLSAAGTPLAEWGTQGSAPGQLDQPAGIAVDAHETERTQYTLLSTTAVLRG